jgi:hypothetical protein
MNNFVLSLLALAHVNVVGHAANRSFPEYVQLSCNQVCEQNLASRGAPMWDIQRLCCAQVNNNLQAIPMGSTCFSQAGTCGMYQPSPVGSSCFCPSQYGPAAGQVR